MGCESSYMDCISPRPSRRKQKKIYDIAMTEARGVQRAQTVYAGSNRLPLQDYTDCRFLVGRLRLWDRTFSRRAGSIVRIMAWFR